MSSVRFALSICGEPAEERRSVGEPAGKRSGGEPAEKRSEVIFLASQGQVLVFGVIYQHRANDVASFARELLPRTFGFAMGSAAVFVPQVEVFEIWDPVLFKALEGLFLIFWEFEFVVFLDDLVPEVRTLPSGVAIHLSERRQGRRSSRRFSSRSPC